MFYVPDLLRIQIPEVQAGSNVLESGIVRSDGTGLYMCWPGILPGRRKDPFLGYPDEPDRDERCESWDGNISPNPARIPVSHTYRIPFQARDADVSAWYRNNDPARLRRDMGGTHSHTAAGDNGNSALPVRD